MFISIITSFFYISERCQLEDNTCEKVLTNVSDNLQDLLKHLKQRWPGIHSIDILTIDDSALLMSSVGGHL